MPSTAAVPQPTRRRLYLFERAYLDYAARLRQAVTALRRGTRPIGRWFWRGPGATATEVLVRLALVASGLLFAVLYVRYEQEYGQGISVRMVLAGGFLSVGVWVFTWGWKAPAHVAARAVAAVAAVSVGMLLGLTTLAALVAAFAAYLLALVALTAASVLVFVPMRLAHGVWLLWRHIYRRCPYDDCGRAGLPIHVCSCGRQYPDLLPSFYGLWYHTCRHADREVRLPTMDFLGRKRLPRLCRHCRRPLVLSSFGELPERPIVVVGGPGAGKTVFLRQATRALRDRLATLPGGSTYVDAEHQESELAADLALLDRGQVPAKTGGDVRQALGLAVRLGKPHPLCDLLYLFDAPGEHFTSLERFGRKQVIQYLSGIVLLVDPFTLEPLAERGRRLAAGLKSSEAPLDQVAAVLIAGVNQMLVRHPTDRCTVPLAVVLAKADALPAEEYPFLAGLRPEGGRLADGGLSGRCREALRHLGAGNSVRALEQKFATVRYFACSALGRMPDWKDTRPFQPAGVTEPFLWLLGVHLDDSSGNGTGASVQARSGG